MMRYFLRIVEKINTDTREHIVRAIIALLALTLAYLISSSIFLSFIIGSAAAIILFNWDSRIFFGISLIFLLSCPILLVMEKEAVAEEIAVYAYYMLILGVSLHIVCYVRELYRPPTRRK